MAKNKLSILLIKENTPDYMIVKQQEGVNMEVINGCIFYYKNSFTTPPKWLEKFFDNRLACGERLRSTSATGLLIVPRQYNGVIRKFAVCFGYGRSLLMPACIEERFGLVSTLNSINADEIRSVDIHRLDSSSLKNRIQSSKLADISDLEFDVEKSLLRHATGLSNDEEMGKTVSGSDALSVSVEVDIDSIGEFLDKCYQKYKSENYRGAFSWIDNIYPLKKSALIETLDNLLLQKLHTEGNESTFLAVPDIIDWEYVSELKFGEQGETHQDILIEEFRQEVLNEAELTIPFLKHNYVYAYDANGGLRYKWPYYRCIYSEIEHEGKLYMLNSASWYQVDTDYRNHIIQTYQNAPLSNVAVINYNHANEGEYNEALANSRADYFLMDRNLIPSGIARNGVEFCDVFTQNRQMIHVKKYGGSQVIAHLFNQGQVSGSMLFDQQFRHEVNLRLPQGWAIPMQGFTPNNYEIVYAIISKYNTPRPYIPFFSMVVFHDIYRTLTGFGYNVTLKSILSI